MESWRDELPDDLKVNPSLSKFETPADLAKSYTELEAWKGNAIRVPSKDAGPDDWKQFTGKLTERVPQLMFKPDPTSPEQMALYYQTLGVPEKAEQYELAKVEGLEQNTLEKTRVMALAGKLTAEQHKAVTNWLAEEAKDVAQQVQQAHLEDEAKLTEKWGESLNQRKARVDQFLQREAVLPIEGLDAAGYLIFDKILDALTGKGPQAFDLPSNHEVGPSVAELQERKGELITRMTKEGLTMPPDERRRLQDKLKLILEQIGKATTKAA